MERVELKSALNPVLSDISAPRLSRNEERPRQFPVETKTNERVHDPTQETRIRTMPAIFELFPASEVVGFHVAHPIVIPAASIRSKMSG